MKNIIIFIAWFSPLFGIAQDSLKSYIEDEYYNVFKDLSFKNCNSDRFYDNHPHQKDFDDLLNSAAEKPISLYEFYNVLKEFEYMRISGRKKELKWENFAAMSQYNRDRNLCPIAIFAGNYFRIDNQSFEKGLIDTTDEGNLKNKGELNPFIEKRLLLSVLPCNTYHYGDSIDIYLDTNLIFGNIKLSEYELTITIDGVVMSKEFYSGKIYKVKLNRDEDDISIVVKIKYEDKDYIYVMDIAGMDFPLDLGFESYDIGAKSIYGLYDSTIIGCTRLIGKNEVTYSYVYEYSDYARAKYYIKYGNKNTNKCLTNPLIFVEGVDFGTKYLPTGCSLLKCGGLGIVDIYTGYKDGVMWYENILPEFADGDINSTPSYAGKYLFDKLYEDNYDVIYLDFQNGSTYMENNSMVLVNLIEKINDMKCSSNDLVICGASMGGQIVRFALSYMETNNIKHCTRDMIMFDSPNKGANIPIGLQSAIVFFANENIFGLFEDAINARDSKLMRPAARQLLTRHFHGNYDADNLRVNFISRLYKLKSDFPLRVNRLSFISGNLDGVPVIDSGRVINEGGITGRELLFSGKSAGIGGSEYEKYIRRRLVGIYYEVYSSGNEDMLSKISLRRESGKGKSKDIVFKQPKKLNLDFVPGGQNDANRSLSFNLEMPIGRFTIFQENSKAIPFTTFIPTNSSLNLFDDNMYYNCSNIKTNEPSAKLHPFDMIYSSGGNLLHVQLKRNMVDVLINYLRLQSTDILINLNKNAVGESKYRNWSSPNNKILGKLININESTTFAINTNKYCAPSWGSKSGKFEVYTSSCGTEINLQSSGLLSIGNIDGSYPANLYIDENSSLNLNDGCKIDVNKNSGLFLESGSFLNVTGKVIFNIMDGAVLNIGCFLKTSPNSVINFTGKGKICFTDKFMYQNNMNSFIYFSDGLEVVFLNDLNFSSAMSLVSFENVTLYIAENTSLRFESPIKLNNITIQRYGAGNWNSIRISTSVSNNILINKLRVKGGNIGLYFDNPNIKGIQLNDVRFESCDVGLQTYGCGIEGSLRFTACTYGWYAEAQQNGSKVTISSTKTNNPIRYKAQAGGHLLLYGSYIEMGKNVFFDKTSTYYQNPAYITLSCCQFVSSPLSFEQVMPNLSTQFNDPAYNTSGGWNVFNDSKITLSNCADVLLKDGYNDFLDPNNQGVLQGTLQNPSFQKGYAVNFTRNAIDPAPLSYTPVDRSEADLYVNDWKLKVTLPVNTLGTANQMKNGGCWNNGNGQGKSKQVAEWNGEDLLVYPNPSSGRFTVKSSDMIRSVHICNMLGTSIPDRTNWNGVAKYFTVDLSDLPDGIYLLQVTDVLGQMHTSRLVVSH